MKAFLRSVLCGLFLSVSATMASAATCGDPGAEFNWPDVCTGYLWSVDMDGLSPSDELLSFTVNVGAGGAAVPVFQVFGFTKDAPGGIGPFHASFDLFLDGVATPWTQVDPDLYFYHNFFNQRLSEGSTVFSVRYTGPSGPLYGTHFADVRFGDVIPGVPAPPALLGILTGLALLFGLGAARRQLRAGSA